MKQIYLKDKNQIAFFKEKASAEFWDKHWNISKPVSENTKFIKHSLFLPYVKQYLPEGSLLIEGGCGTGEVVFSLLNNGYRAIGVDFAENTIRAVKNIAPEADFIIGDVMNLPIKNDSVDGYISGGVIEHFWLGYDLIAQEIYRVLGKKGFLFITFPHISFIRRIKIILKLYPICNTADLENKLDDFYQFALEKNSVIAKFTEQGFSLVKSIHIDGIKGFKDEVSLFKKPLQKIYDNKSSFRVKLLLDIILKTFASHCIMLIMKKN